jgi:UDP-N-acetylmuramate--alanine ligase
MSAIARLFFSLWFRNIIGIDSQHNEITKTLSQEGVHVIIWHGIYNVQSDDFLIYSSACLETPEVQKSMSYIWTNHKKIFPPLTYFQFLGEISKCFTTIAIAGTHGKSTTTALTGHILSSHCSDFWLCIVWAGVADRQGKNIIYNKQHKKDIRTILDHITNQKWPKIEHLMKKHLFVVEACEYKRQFLSLDTDIALITNIELDHVEIYGTFDNYLDTFKDFVSKTKKYVITFDDIAGLDALVSTWTHIRFANKSIFKFDHLLGKHNHQNASLALEVAIDRKNRSPSTEPQSIWSLRNTIQSFTSLRRRWELLWHNNHWVPIITDYAHHPTELSSTIQAVYEKYIDPALNDNFQKEKGKESEDWEHWRIHVIFQPHQARRVIEFWDEFVSILQSVHSPIIYSIYTARETIQDIATYNIVSTSLQSQIPTLESFEDLWELFVQQFDGTYITKFESVQEKIEKTTTGVILICTAGDLDWVVRKSIVV